MTLPFIRCIAAAILTVAGAQAENVASPIARRTTATPIEHLIVVVGENLSFDNLFATYEPAAGQTVGNLLSRGIVDKDGAPGPHFASITQRPSWHACGWKTCYLRLPADARLYRVRGGADSNSSNELSMSSCGPSS